MTERKQLLDIAEAAEFLNVSQTSLRRWTNSGQLKCLRVGRRRERRFRREDLIAFMEHQPGHREPLASIAPRSGSQTVIDGLTVPHGTHLGALYTSDLGRVQLAIRFLASGFDAGGFCFVVAPKRLRDAIVAQLEQLIPKLGDHIDEERFVLSDYARSAQSQLAYFDEQFRAALGAGARSIRVVGDVSEFARRVPEGFLEYEAGYDRFIATQFPVVTLCEYDVRKLSGAQVFGALKAHPHSCNYPAQRWLA